MKYFIFTKNKLKKYSSKDTLGAILIVRKQFVNIYCILCLESY